MYSLIPKQGIFAIYKPKGITSYDIIRKIKKILGKKIKIGHGGTLDPIAEGVLVIGIGREYTKKLGNILKNSTKEYIMEILLDKISDTYDITGEIKEIPVKEPPGRDTVESILKSFLGEIEQVPPAYSAIKIHGERACDLIRKKKYTIEEIRKMIKPKKVKIESIEILEYNFPRLVLKVVCSSGTYVRSLAYDIGKKLNCGGIVNSVIRTRVDKFSIENCIKIN